MELKKYNVYFFLFTLVVVSVVTYFIFSPFLMAILLAAILAVVLQKPYNFFLLITKQRRKISAFFIALIGILVFSFLFLGVIGLIINGVSNLYQNASSGGSYQGFIDNIVSNINNSQFLHSIGINNIINADSVKAGVKQIGQSAFTILQQTYQSVAHLFFMTIVMFFTLYYFLIGGKDLIGRIMFLSPLKNSHEKILIQKFISISRATLKGTLVVGTIQGALGGILFAIVGIPSAIAWGVVMMFLSLIPMVGTGLVWLPAGVIMFLLGNVWQAITIFAVGFGLVSTIDNFLKPKLVGKDTQMHPLMVFFATLGGLNLFGFVGFIVGPIVVALFLSLWEIYGVEFKSQLKRLNS